jgi:hypothetical protein
LLWNHLLKLGNHQAVEAPLFFRLTYNVI